MKALSLTQPWAWLVVHGGKDIENRRWNTKLRGEFLIHAAKGMKQADYETAWDCARGINQNVAWDIPPERQLQRGGIVGVAELIEVWEPTSNCPSRWHFPDQYGFQLRNVRPLPFVPCKGALGFWEVPPSVLAQLNCAASGAKESP